MVATCTAAYLLLTADYGPDDNVLIPVRFPSPPPRASSLSFSNPGFTSSSSSSWALLLLAGFFFFLLCFIVVT